MSNPRSNFTESYNSYASSSDVDNSIVIQSTPYTSSTPDTSSTQVTQTNESKQVSKFDRLKKPIIVLICLGLIGLLIWLAIDYNKSPLISHYENKMKSGFSNKDQYEDPNNNDYDINYLVEQMIYKEFSPSDKKKYLNLPQVLKEQLMIDYLIQKI